MKLGRHKGEEVICEYCGNTFIALVQRIKQGMGRFCSRDCYNAWQRINKKSNKYGKENGKVYPNNRGGFFVQWYTEEGKPKNSPWHKWAWEMNFGEIPEGYVVEYIDGDKNNIIIENLQLGLTRQGKKLHPQPRKPVSAETRQKIGERTKELWKLGVFDFHRTGKKSTKVLNPKDRSKGLRQRYINNPNLKQQISNKLKGRVFSDDHIQKLRAVARRGSDSPFWKGGVKSTPYPEEFDRYLKAEIRSRDEHKCQSCGENVYRSRRGHVHHINGNKQDCDKSNLVLLCVTCHNAVHSRNTLTSNKIRYFKSLLTQRD